MTNINTLNLIREKDINTITTLIKTKGKTKVLSEFSNLLDKRAYFTIDAKGNITRKLPSLSLPFFAFNDNEMSLAQFIVENASLKEKQNFDKIERFSNLNIDKVKKNLIKTLMNGNIEFAKKYGKELFLRDSNEFYNLLSTFVLIGNSNNLKALNLIALKSIMKEYDENIFYLFISYITKFRDDTQVYENCMPSAFNLATIKEQILKDQKLLNSKTGLGVLANIYLLENFNIENKNKIIAKLAFEIQNYHELIPLSKIEKNFLSLFLR